MMLQEASAICKNLSKPLVGNRLITSAFVVGGEKEHIHVEKKEHIEIQKLIISSCVVN